MRPISYIVLIAAVIISVLWATTSEMDSGYWAGWDIEEDD